ncbi:SDR family oxidoreductase [Rugamonas sp.]|uniref:SDR family oxidoreductase n=1 Tax=Rugamonas sp. TaxID=1926287 RepID=UPI0025EA27ED|nr:SDR family oxidoreductase [Rugamonas sp.]
MPTGAPNAQRVFITGASSGIGAALALRYAAQGAIVGLLGRRGEALERLRAGCAQPERHRCYVADVSDAAAVAMAAQQFLEHAGGIDVVIASAGVSVGTLTEYGQDVPVIVDIFNVNVLGTVFTFAPFINAMKNQRTPARLVGIGSVAGIRGLPGAEAYSASKSAVITYCESLRLELKRHGIAVVTLCPGYIDTPMTRANAYRMPFLMAPERFADAALRKIAAGNRYAVIPWQMGVVAKFLRLLPNAAYDGLFANAPQKKRRVQA